MATKTPSLGDGTGEAFGLPPAATLRRLKISREVAWYLVTRGIEFPTCVPYIKSPEPDWVKGAAFDPERVDHVLKSFSYLRHTQGRLAGQPLTPDPWQVAYILAPIFGWVKKNEYGEWVRIIRNFYLDIPRKNGKSTLAGGLAIYLTAADGEPSAQVLAAATGRDQAAFVFDPIKFLCEKSPALRGHVKPFKSTIIHPKSGSVFKVVSSVADALHGANVHGAVIDELHLHKKKDLVEAIETGTGSRQQPLVIKITTADEGKPQTIYAQNRHYIEQLAKKIFRDEAKYGVVFAVDRDANPFLESTQRKANPGYGVSPTRDFLKSEAEAAKNDPAKLAAYKRLYLGIRTKQTTAYFDLKEWRANSGKGRIQESELAGRACYGGLDLGSVSDLTALCWLFPQPEGDGFDALWRIWTPEDNLDKLDERTAGSASKLWVPQGWLQTTPGNVTDYAFIKAQMLEDAKAFDIQSVGFDRWNSSHLVTELMDEGINMVKVGQGYMSMNPAMREASRLIKLGAAGPLKDRRPRLRNGGNPAMVWMIDNLAHATDPAGNVKPDKANSADKIDGVAALCNAMFEAIEAPEPIVSAYESQGVRVA